MNVSAASSVPVTPPAQGGGVSPAIVALQASMEAQVELVEALIAVDLQNAQAAQKMEIAGQIIDVYA